MTKYENRRPNFIGKAMGQTNKGVTSMDKLYTTHRCKQCINMLMNIVRLVKNATYGIVKNPSQSSPNWTDSM